MLVSMQVDRQTGKEALLAYTLDERGITKQDQSINKKLTNQAVLNSQFQQLLKSHNNE